MPKASLLIVRRLVAWGALLALCAIPACHCSGSIPSLGSIGPSGGTLTNSACGITISVPAGALTTTVPFAIQSESSGEPAIQGRVLTSAVCNITPDLPLAKPATVTMAYQPSLVPQGSDPNDTDLRLAPGGTQTIRLQDIAVDTSSNTVSGSTQGLGTFFTSCPQGPQPGSVNLNPPGPVSLQVGQQQQFSATVLDDIGNPDTLTPVVWSETPNTVGNLTAAGLFTAVSPGHAQVTATAGDAGSTADVFVVSGVASPPSFTWENPLPQGNDLRALSIIGGLPVAAGGNGTVIVGGPTGSFTRVLSLPSLSLAGVGAASGQLVLSGNLDQVTQDIEHLAGVAFALSDAGIQDLLQVDPGTIAPASEYSDGTSAWVVGSGNDALAFEADGGWDELQTPVAEALIDIDQDPVEGARVVGARGEVYRLAGTQWSPIWDTPLETLFGQAAILGHQVFAVDEAANLQVFQEGSGWQPLAASLPYTATQVTWLGKLGSQLALSILDSTQTSHLLFLTGSSQWVEASGLSGSDLIYTGAGPADATGWVAGSNGALYSCDGGILTPLRTGSTDDIAALSATPQGALFAATNACVDSACQQQVGNVLERASNGSWAAMPNPGATGISGGLSAILAVSDTEIFIGGPGQAWEFDGSQFNTVNLNQAQTNYQGFAACGSDVWAAGTGGVIALFDSDAGFTPQNIPTQNDMYSIACNSASDIYAVGDYELIHFDGKSWTNVDTGNVNNAPWRTITLVAGLPWIGGQADYVIYNDGIGWQAAQNPAGVTFHQVNGIFGNGPGEVYVVGAVQRPRVGALIRFDGENWTQLDPGTDHPLLSLVGIAGSSPTQLWFGGSGGAILTAP